MPPRLPLSLLLSLLAWRSADCSLGDVQPAYRGCLRACAASGCVGAACVPSCAAQRPDDLGGALRLLLWDCEVRPAQLRQPARVCG
jgi:hypothetical protein